MKPETGAGPDAAVTAIARESSAALATARQTSSLNHTTESSAPTERVYHFTDTARLPFIVAMRQLKPGRNQVGNYPDPDFLWATVNARGDATASVNRQGWRSGVVQQVRFTLAAEDFEPWPAILARYPQWTPEHVDRLERRARTLDASPSCWRCRVDPLPAEHWLRIETRTYTGSWKPFDYRGRPVVDSTAGQDNTAILDIGGQLYVSRQIIEDGNRTRYECTRITP